jgi:D-aspartate oxidase
MKIGVLGAGVIGLNTALRLQTEFPSGSITLLADRFEEETLSHGAAGIFRPGTAFAGPSPQITE